MEYKTHFRLAMKFLGVYFFFEGTTRLISCIDSVLGLILPPFGIWSFGTYGTNQALASLAGMVIGLYLFFGGRWIVDRAIPGNRNYCHECGYDLTGNLQGICSECGTAFRVPEATDTP